MINIVRGEICSGADKIDFSSTSQVILSWVNRNNIKRINPVKGDVYFYESNDVNCNNVNTKCILKFWKGGIDTVALRRVKCLNNAGRSDNFGLAELKEEFTLLVQFVEAQMQRKPDRKSVRQCIWEKELFIIEVTFDPLSAEVAIFLFRK
ncbi:MAG: hypothetical protein V4857_05335 [Pseudomonadota bacterium]